VIHKAEGGMDLVNGAHLDGTGLALAGAGLLLAGLLKGFTGLGFSTCALPFLVLAVGIKTAVALVLVPAIASNIMLLWRVGHVRETVLRFWPMYVALVPGVANGISLLAWANGGTAARSLGLITMLYAGLSLWRPNLQLAPRFEAPMQLPVGLLNGFLTGLTGSQIIPLLPYMMGLRLDPDRFVQAVNIAVTFTAGLMLAGLAIAGLLPRELAFISILGIVPAGIGTLIGNRARALVPTAQFRLLVLYTLLFLGAMLASSWQTQLR
jgi:uncharacterized protein